MKDRTIYTAEIPKPTTTYNELARAQVASLLSHKPKLSIATEETLY